MAPQVVAAGGDVNSTNHYGRPILWFPCDPWVFDPEGKLAILLQEPSLNLDIVDSRGDTPDVVAEREGGLALAAAFRTEVSKGENAYVHACLCVCVRVCLCA